MTAHGAFSSITSASWRCPAAKPQKSGLCTALRQQHYVCAAIMKYGWERVRHEILATVNSYEDAERLEKHFIELQQSTNPEFGYNAEKGGRHIKGYHLREQTKAKMSASRTGEKNWIYGKHLDEATKKKLSDAHKGKTLKPESIQKQLETKKANGYYNARAVIGFDEAEKQIGVFPTLAEAGRYVGVKTQDIYNCCIGKQKTTHGTRWFYIDCEELA